MPRFCRPNQTYKIVLDEDKDVVPTPAFLCRSVPLLEHQEIAEHLDGQNTNSIAEYFDSNVKAVLKVCVGWENIRDPSTNEEIAFSEVNLRKVLTAKEVMEVLRKALFNDTLKEDEKKS